MLTEQALQAGALGRARTRRRRRRNARFRKQFYLLPRRGSALSPGRAGRHYRARRIREHLRAPGASPTTRTPIIGHNPGVFERVMYPDIGAIRSPCSTTTRARAPTTFPLTRSFYPTGRTTSSTRGPHQPTGETITLQTCTGDNQRVRCVMAPLGTRGAKRRAKRLVSGIMRHIRRHRMAFDTRGRGGIGIRSGLKIRLFGLWVRVPPPLPVYLCGKVAARIPPFARGRPEVGRAFSPEERIKQWLWSSRAGEVARLHEISRAASKIMPWEDVRSDWP